MGFIRFHAIFSFFCALTAWGFANAGKEKIKENGWLDNAKKITKKEAVLYFFVPFLNILIPITIILMIFVKKNSGNGE